MSKYVKWNFQKMRKLSCLVHITNKQKIWVGVVANFSDILIFWKYSKLDQLFNVS